MVVEDSALIVTREEYVWQSYFIAAYLAQPYNASGTVTGLQAAVTATGLLWKYSATPRTLWLNVTLGFTSRVFATTVPNSSIRTYLGPTTYIGEVQVLGNCSQLLAAVRAADPKRTVYALRANTSLADCWPAEGVTVAAPGFSLLGMPDDSVTLDLGGLHDAMILAPGATVSLRYLTLTGLGSHVEHDDDVELADSNVEGLGLTTALLWAFQYPRRNTALHLLHTTLVLPDVELQQYGRLAVPDPAVPALVYFASLGSYFQGSALTASNASDTASALAPAASSEPRPPPAAAANVTELLSFRSLILPGIKASDTNLTCWPGLYTGNWSEQLYDTAGDDGDAGGGGDWEAWRIGVLAGGLVFVLLAAIASALLYRSIARSRVSQGKKSVALDVEVGGDRAGGVQQEAPSAAVVVSVRRESEPRRPVFYDSFDDPVSELGFFKRGVKPNAQEIQIILDRANSEAAEYNLELTKVLGHGSFGVVYGGLWNGVKCAVKVMAFDELSSIRPLGSEEARQQCLREAALCCTMHHPNVVATHSYYLKPLARVSLLLDFLMQRESYDGRMGFKPLSDNRRGLGAEGAEAEAAPQPPRPRVKHRKPAVTDWKLFLVQECCDGGTLREAIDAGVIFSHSRSQPKPFGRRRRTAAPAPAADAGADAGADAAGPDPGKENAASGPHSLCGGAATGLNLAVADAVFRAVAAAAAAAPSPHPHHHLPPAAAADADANTSTRPDLPTAQVGFTEHAELRGVPPEAASPLLATPEAAATLAPGSAPPVPAPARSPDQGARVTHIAASAADAHHPAADAHHPAADAHHPPCAAADGHGPLGKDTCGSWIVAAAANAINAANAAPVLGVPMPPAEPPLPADLAPVVRAALGIASGVAYLHSRSIIHGDLSASNVLLTTARGTAADADASGRGRAYDVRISDFGLSLLLEAGQQCFKNMRNGTPYYQAPEVMEEGTISLAADIYSVGVLMWELYHGPAPWRRACRVVKLGEGPRREGAAILAAAAATAARAAAGGDVGTWDDPYYRIRSCDMLRIHPDCPAAYARVVRRCLSADPAARPTARSLVKTLLGIERGMAAAEQLGSGGAGGSGGGDAAAVLPVRRPPTGAVMALLRPNAGGDWPLPLEDVGAAEAGVRDALVTLRAVAQAAADAAAAVEEAEAAAEAAEKAAVAAERAAVAATVAKAAEAAKAAKAAKAAEAVKAAVAAEADAAKAVKALEAPDVNGVQAGMEATGTGATPSGAAAV